ncbi:hypothetical protein EVAR_45708_1 [Eumeta japonica]|uniref:Uncharacterized protein n=1 Tax=Eumeta variegata TaxID=151549 RepID=A0A4C1WV23_EUMVA|nr:hypothetical protein EVAR_45708_1 [Eumeta japonica]
MTHCRVPSEPSVPVRARNKRSLFHSIGRCVREEERQRPHTTYTLRSGRDWSVAEELPVAEELYSIVKPLKGRVAHRDMEMSKE